MLKDKICYFNQRKNQIEVLSNLSTKHIVLPEESLESEYINPGFIMNYIDIDTKKDILLVSKEHLINEVKETEEELMLLGKNHFLLDDTKSSNIFYNETLHLFDPDSFIYDKKTNFSQKNIEIFVWYFIRDIIFSLNKDITKKEQISLVRKLNYLYKKDNYYLLSKIDSSDK